MRIRFHAALLALALASSAESPVGLSAKIGVPVSETFETNSFHALAVGRQEGYSATRRYTAGLGGEVRLPHRLGAEVDVLYKRLGYDIISSTSAIPVIYEHTWTTANSWEIPVMATYRAGRVLGLTPRFLAGISFRTVTGASTIGQCVPNAPAYSSLCVTTEPNRQVTDPHLSNRSSIGATFGAGIEKRLGPLRLTPEFRYTRWRADAGSERPFVELRSNPNQLDFLFGIGF